jgi:hypothetical protein
MTVFDMPIAGAKTAGRQSAGSTDVAALSSEQRRHRTETLLNEALVDSFPASDPVSSLRFD